jgi:hypothetical protein
MIGQVAALASTTPIDVHTDERRYVPQFRASGGWQKKTPYRHRLTGGLVQQGLSVAGGIRDGTQFGRATDKRYSF